VNEQHIDSIMHGATIKEHLPLILYMPFHSVCDAEGLNKFSVSGMSVLQMYTIDGKKCTVSGSIGLFVLQDFIRDLVLVQD